MRFAMRTKDLKIISHSMKGIIKSDQLFTIPGIIFIIAGGFRCCYFFTHPNTANRLDPMVPDHVFDLRHYLFPKGGAVAEKDL